MRDVPPAPWSLQLSLNPVKQESPAPGPRTNTSPPPVGNRAVQQEASGGQASKASSAAPHRSPSLSLPPEPLLTSPPKPFPPSPPPSVEKLSSTRPVPAAKKFRDRCCKRQETDASLGEDVSSLHPVGLGGRLCRPSGSGGLMVDLNTETHQDLTPGLSSLVMREKKGRMPSRPGRFPGSH